MGGGGGGRCPLGVVSSDRSRAPSLGGGEGGEGEGGEGEGGEAGHGAARVLRGCCEGAARVLRGRPRRRRAVLALVCGLRRIRGVRGR